MPVPSIRACADADHSTRSGWASRISCKGLTTSPGVGRPREKTSSRPRNRLAQARMGSASIFVFRAWPQVGSSGNVRSPGDLFRFTNSSKRSCARPPASLSHRGFFARGVRGGDSGT
eukprot:7570852-Lingulodinium_polyedra.AAC.1